MNLERLKEPFPADQIEWRVGQAGKSGDKVWAKVLAYITARAGQDRLDEVFGVLGWEIDYIFNTGAPNMAGGVMAYLRLWDTESKRWVLKTDGAEQTDFDAFKGGLSGAFKRACSSVGIGRYLYDLEAGFAKIVDKGTAGAKYQPADDKKGIPAFHWLPPELPQWALPKGEIKKNHAPMLTRAELVTPIFPIEWPAPSRVELITPIPYPPPTPFDDVPHSAGEAHAPEVYTFKSLKKFAGRRIDSIPMGELKSYIDWFEKNGKNISPPIMEELEIIKAHLNVNDTIPF